MAVELAAQVATAAHLLLSRRDVPSTVGWAGLVILAPMAGLVLYWLFGINRITLKLMQWAAQAQVDQLLEGHCRIRLSPPPFDHTKLMLIDDAWSFLGSANSEGPVGRVSAA